MADEGRAGVLSLRTHNASFDITRIGRKEAARSRLSKFPGGDVDDDWGLVLAASLDCIPAQVEDVLRARGDRELLTLARKRRLGAVLTGHRPPYREPDAPSTEGTR
ncbi:hypothetical protein [Mycolicibacterium chubuense]|uniref:hypothetical protein n=1 Tax=Mycolicibacterium chubuense TaxID=1800 RepID=UPI0013014BF2|nr:hypothetical protein [Mycolicibacterium chubuense]